MGISGKFLGDTQGNANLKPDLTNGGCGGSGESHSGSPSGKFLGTTNGNTNLKPDRTSGVGGGSGGKYKAGGKH